MDILVLVIKFAIVVCVGFIVTKLFIAAKRDREARGANSDNQESQVMGTGHTVKALVEPAPEVKIIGGGDWTPHDGGPCPVLAGTLVDVRFSGGLERFAMKAMHNDECYGDVVDGLWYSASCYHWNKDDQSNDIIAWRLHRVDEPANKSPSAQADATAPDYSGPELITIHESQFDKLIAIEAAARIYHKTGSNTAWKRLGRELGK